jgi:hypothetical protein
MSQGPTRTRLLGRTFLHPLWDYSLIGGGLSLLAVLVVLLLPEARQEGLFDFRGPQLGEIALMSYAVLLSNSAHFASSTVRLYTKPGATGALPFLSMAFPLVCFGILTLCMAWPESLGRNLQALYLTWSPYHYAAQAYGLAVMYCYRSGCIISDRDKKWLWRVAMLPFVYAFLYTGGGRTGLSWLVQSDILSWPVFGGLLRSLKLPLQLAAFIGPVWLFSRMWRRSTGPMPVISLLVIASNGVWWFVMPPLEAFLVATLFHGIQYLAIILIFHVKEQTSLPDNRHSALWHVGWFYGVSLALGYALFHIVPRAYMALGFGTFESYLLVAAAINVHHFIVDAYIWRLKKSDSNRKVIDANVPVTEAVQAPA